MKTTTDQIQVIGAGFGRTGTNSLKVALNILGYKTYHMYELRSNRDDLDIWINEINKPKQERNITESVLKPRNYTAAVDAPSSTLYVMCI